MIYPGDANGDALRRMKAAGDDLTKPRNVDFTVIFANAISARQFAEHFRTLGYEVSVEAADTDGNFTWDVVVIRYMVPSHEEISNFEKALQSIADDWGGHNDGWGCFSEAS